MNLRDILSKTPFFNKDVFHSEQLDRLVEELQHTNFDRGDFLMKERDLGNSMFVIVSGKVSVSVHEPGGDQVVAELGPGEFVGEMSLITGERRSASVRAKGRVEAVEIDKARLAPALAADSDLAQRIAGIIEQRHAELVATHRNAGRWVNASLGADTIATRMREFYGAEA